RLLLAEPPPTRQQTRPHARCLAAPTGTSLLGNPVVWLTFLAHFPGPASWPSFLAQSLDPGGNGPLPPFPCRRPGLQSAQIGTPGRACLPMGPILLHKAGHCRSDGCSRRGRGCSSGVEHHVANVRVVGSNPIARSNVQLSADRVGPLIVVRTPWSEHIGTL